MYNATRKVRNHFFKITYNTIFLSFKLVITRPRVLVRRAGIRPTGLVYNKYKYNFITSPSTATAAEYDAVKIFQKNTRNLR